MASIGALCTSTSGVLVVLAGSGAATTAFFRCVFAIPLLFVLALRDQRRLGPRPTSQRLRAAAAGLIFGVDLVLVVHAINEVGAGIATVLGNLQVVFVAAAAWMFFGERPTKRLVAALPIVLLGVVLVSGLTGRPSFGGDPVAGIAFGLGASLTYACFLLILRSATGTSQVAGPLLDATAGAVVSTLVLGVIFGSFSLTPGWTALGWLLVLAVSSQNIGWLFITWSLPRLSRTAAAVILLLQPAAALGLAGIVLAQQPTLVQIAGAALIVGGVMAVARRETTIDPAP
jgi:drug/metabolite transporter (DMT)-like permease